MRSSRTNLAAAALLVIHTGLLAWCGYRYSPTLDEVGHLPGGLVIWQYGRFDLYRVNPPLPRAVAAIPVALLPHQTDWSKFSDAPGARPEWAIGSDFIRANGERAFWLFALARWACIPFSLVGAIVCWRWGRALFGETEGLIALALWCFCPNIIGNGSLVTPDVPAAALGLLAAFCYWRWLRQPTWRWALLAGAQPHRFDGERPVLQNAHGFQRGVHVRHDLGGHDDTQRPLHSVQCADAQERGQRTGVVDVPVREQQRPDAGERTQCHARIQTDPVLGHVQGGVDAAHRNAPYRQLSCLDLLQHRYRFQGRSGQCTRIASRRETDDGKSGGEDGPGRTQRPRTCVRRNPVSSGGTLPILILDKRPSRMHCRR